jgi:hypothetical protein
MSTKPKWQKVGSVLKARKGGFYIKVEAQIPAGSSLQMKCPREEVNFFLQRGTIDEAEAEKRLAKIPDFVKYNLYLPPSDGNGTSEF